MYTKTISLLLAVSLLSSSCSSTRKSIALGVGTGAVSGATIGAMTNKDHAQGALLGLGIGALVGGIASYFIHGGLEDRDNETRKDTLFNLEKNGVFGDAPEENKAQSRWHERDYWPREPMGGRNR